VQGVRWRRNGSVGVVPTGGHGACALSAALVALSFVVSGCGGGGRQLPTAPSAAQVRSIRSTVTAFESDLAAARVVRACELLTTASGASLGAEQGESCTEVLNRVVAVSTPVQLMAMAERATDLKQATIRLSNDVASWRGRRGARYVNRHWLLIAAPAGSRAIMTAAAVESWLAENEQQVLYGSTNSRF
jgi:hypothetical protein